MPSWAEQTLNRMAEKYHRGIPLAAQTATLPYGGGHGRWFPAPHDGNSWWTGGFWPGLMWLLHCATGEADFRAEALRADALLACELSTFELLNHDVGFMYLLSAGAEYKLTGSAHARRDALHAATLLAGRFNPAGFIRAWNGESNAGWAIVDCMMNLCLLYWATAQTDDPRFARIARIHADTTLREFVRPDSSCAHIVIFDPLTGTALEKPAGQGFAAGSSWSRGQAWALYGFALSYLVTAESRYLQTALRIAEYFVAHIRPDGLTNCDFCQPKEVERIDNIAAACASCGLLELEKLAPPAQAAHFRAAAETMLHALCETCADFSNETAGVLQKCTAAYHSNDAGTHVNLVYGDYFFAEALLKLCGKDPMLWLS